ncbi:MAG: iron chelate uptake ABC transporter family permease subunit [Gammaproteobacteria bacterium]|nr:iron chelate uptake ABC transporter family permease subunit [Gammaproteobacteria bacterium]
MDDFVLRALAAGLGVALVGAPLGCFVVWRRMAYFGEALAHAALLGVALGLLLDLAPTVGIVATCLAAALLLVGLGRHQPRLAGDTLFGIVAHGALATGLVVLSRMETVRVDLFAYLFGDILAVGPGDLAWIGVILVVVAVAMAFLWRPLLAITVHADLAAAEGIHAGRVHLGFMLLIALVTAVAMKVVGILLVTSLLVIPAATARHFARTPEQMVFAAMLVGVLAVTGGLAGSLWLDTPSGPTIVVAATLLFALALFQRVSPEARDT